MPWEPCVDLLNSAEAQLASIKDEVKPFKSAYADLFGQTKNANDRLGSALKTALAQRAKAAKAKEASGPQHASGNTLAIYVYGKEVGQEVESMCLAEGRPPFDKLCKPLVITGLLDAFVGVFVENSVLCKLEIDTFMDKFKASKAYGGQGRGRAERPVHNAELREVLSLVMQRFALPEHRVKWHVLEGCFALFLFFLCGIS